MQEGGERQSNFFDTCNRCSLSCCQGARPPLTFKRRQIIEEYLKKQKLHVENPFTQESYAFPREDVEGYCIFYDKKTRKCQVHPVKPETCTAGPITFAIDTKDKNIEWFLKMEKICPLAGAMEKNEKTFEKHLRSAKTEILRLVSELDSESLRAILGIDEPETFKIGKDKLEKSVLDKLIS